MTFVTAIGGFLIAVGLWAAWRVARNSSSDLIWLVLFAMAGGILMIFGQNWFRVG